MPYINVDEAYILDNTGLQVDNSVDYANANANRNLLDNAYFYPNSLINQRGTSGTVTSGFIYDRWQKSGSTGAVVIQTTGCLNPTDGAGIRQFNSWRKIIDGETYTLSVMLENGNVYSVTGTLDSAVSGYQISKHFIQGSLWGGIQNNSNRIDTIITSNDGSARIRAVKLERGTYSTLANDDPPDRANELAKCQYYFRALKNSGTGYLYIGGFANSGTQFRSYALPPMNVRSSSPTITKEGTFDILAGTSAIAVTDISSSWASNTEGGVTLFATVASGLTSYQPCVLRIGENSAVYISCEV